MTLAFTISLIVLILIVITAIARDIKLRAKIQKLENTVSDKDADTAQLKAIKKALEDEIAKARTDIGELSVALNKLRLDSNERRVSLEKLLNMVTNEHI